MDVSIDRINRVKMYYSGEIFKKCTKCPECPLADSSPKWKKLRE